MPSGAELATAWVRLVPSFEGASDAITKELSSAPGIDNAGKSAGTKYTKGAKAGLKGLVGIVGGAFAATAVAGFFKDSIENARDLGEAGAAVGQIFGDSYADIDKWADSANTELGQSKLEALNAAKTFGIYGQAAGLAGEQNVDFATSMASLATDLASFNNTSPEQAVEALGSALRGESEPLRSYGVLLDDATLRQEALQLGLIKTTKDALTPQQKVLAAQAAIVKQTSVAQGDFARTSGGLANQQRILDATMVDLSATAGEVLLPVVNSLVAAVVPFISWLGENQAVLIGLGVAIGLILVGAFIAWTASIWAANAALLANPITWIVLAIAGLVAGIIWVATQTTFFQDVWAAAMDVIGGIFTWLWESVLKPVFDAIGAVFTWIYNYIILPIVTGIMIYIGLWAAIITWLWQNVISPIFAAIGTVFQWIWNTIIMPIVDFIVAYIQVLGAIFTWLYGNVVKPVFDAVGRAFSAVWNNVIRPVANFIGDAIENVGNTVSDVFGGIAGFVKSAFQAVLGVVRTPMNAIIDLVNSAISGLNSLSVTIPDWVPIVGGQTWGLSLPSIPRLARGATILPRPGGTAAIIGEGGRAESVVDTGGVNALIDQALEGGPGGNVYVQNPFTGEYLLAQVDDRADGRIERNTRVRSTRLSTGKQR